MTIKKLSVSRFKANCTKVLRSMSKSRQVLEITNRGKVVAVVVPPRVSQSKMDEFIGCVSGAISYRKGWDEPLGPEDWEACRA